MQNLLVLLILLEMSPYYLIDLFYVIFLPWCFHRCNYSCTCLLILNSSQLSNMLSLHNPFSNTMANFEQVTLWINVRNLEQLSPLECYKRKHFTLCHSFPQISYPAEGVISFFYNAVELFLCKTQHSIYCMWFGTFYLP